MLQLVFKLFPHLTQQRNTILHDADQEAKNIILRAKEEALKHKEETEKKLSNLSQQITQLEKSIAQTQSGIEKEKRDIISEKGQLRKTREVFEKEKQQLEQRKQDLLKKFEKLARLTPEEARENIMAFWEQKLKSDIAQKIRRAEEEVKAQAEEKAREILVDSMRYGVTDYVVEYTLSTIDIPSEEYKGRIIGKEGRNIRAFELSTGVEVDLDEEGVVKLSSFDPVRREVARVALLSLIKDGRIQPSRIEEVVKKTRDDIEKIIYKEGEKLAHEVGVYNLPREVIQLLGRFKYRFSYGQNMIQHTLEETRIGVALAHELGVNVDIVRLACLLHDIGKVITDKEGSHITLGVDLLKRYSFPKQVIECVATHHEDKPFTCVEGVIVYLADAVSGGRPGARREDVTSYIKRMKAIEDFIKTKEGVQEVLVLQAGREIRVVVNPEQLDDEATVVLCSKLKDDMEKNFSMIPGQIKITGIREFRTNATTRS